MKTIEALKRHRNTWLLLAAVALGSLAAYGTREYIEREIAVERMQFEAGAAKTCELIDYINRASTDKQIKSPNNSTDDAPPPSSTCRRTPSPNRARR
jgi:hypothetical protein